MTSFEKCDFRPMWQKFEADKELKKQLTKDEKLASTKKTKDLCAL
jgi:DNA topoisomerase-1